jgi:uncharacterized protein involved in outer membrane biogenesis
MRRLFRWVFRIALGLVILAVVAAVAVILLLDTMTREMLVSRLRLATGMEVKIAAVHVGLLSPTISIEGLKLYNRPDFGGSLCLDVPELHIEYDPSALRARQLHLTLLRLEVAELSVAKDKLGRSNFEVWKQKARESARPRSAPRRLSFTGIDVLNVTLGKFRQSNLASGRGQEINFGHKNQILRNVKTAADLAPLGLPTQDAAAGLSQLMDSLLQMP